MADATIVYVHGNGNKVRKELLKSLWDKALFGTDLGAASRMAYWAPLRYPAPLPDHLPDPLSRDTAPDTEELAAAAAQTPEEFIAATLDEVGRGAAGRSADGRAPVAGEAALARWLARMTYAAETLGGDGDGGDSPYGGPHQGGGSGAQDVQEALPLPAALRSPVFRMLVKRVFADVHAYFFEGAGEPMRDIVRRELDGLGGDRPLVVIGHSLGSVIAYEVLREQRREVALFTTVGCPLAIREVQDRLALPAAVPPGVAAWTNVSDLRDLVALDHWLRPEYGPPELVTDHLAVNSSVNHHGISEYLRSEPVQRRVRAVFGRVAAEQTR
jgi:hypothetical protein